MSFEQAGCYSLTVMVEYCVPAGGTSSTGGTTGGSTSNGGSVYGNDPFGWGDSNTTTTNTGGGTDPNSITNYFNIDDLEGMDRKNAAEIN